MKHLNHESARMWCTMRTITMKHFEPLKSTEITLNQHDEAFEPLKSTEITLN